MHGFFTAEDAESTERFSQQVYSARALLQTWFVRRPFAFVHKSFALYKKPTEMRLFVYEWD